MTTTQKHTDPKPLQKKGKKTSQKAKGFDDVTLFPEQLAKVNELISRAKLLAVK